MRNGNVLLLCIGLLIAPVVLAQEPPFRVIGYGVHSNGNVVYHYRVINNTAGLPQPVSTGHIEIGRASFDHEPEFVVLPIYDNPLHGEGPRITSPVGWRGYVGGIEGEPGNTVAWEVKTDIEPYPLLPPGQTLTGLSVILPQADPMYLSGHFFAINHKSRDAAGMHISGLIEREDTTPPTLSITANPSVLWPPNNKLVAVTIAVTTKDNYDPEPEIRLESITANEPLEPGDIADATIGSDDRQFFLAAKRLGPNQEGRLYTITYSATDASGNKAAATTTVTVPHDQGK